MNDEEGLGCIAFIALLLIDWRALIIAILIYIILYALFRP